MTTHNETPQYGIRHLPTSALYVRESLEDAQAYVKDYAGLYEVVDLSGVKPYTPPRELPTTPGSVIEYYPNCFAMRVHHGRFLCGSGGSLTDSEVPEGWVLKFDAAAPQPSSAPQPDREEAWKLFLKRWNSSPSPHAAFSDLWAFLSGGEA